MRYNHYRRGTAYVLVLGIALVVTVMGLGSLMAARSYARGTAAATDWEEAGTLAFSATELAASQLTAAAAAGPTSWRAAYASGQTAFTAPVGRGTAWYVLKDEVDGNLSADYLRPFRVYGIGTVNAVTRVYSVQVRPAGTPMDVLRTAVHAGGNVKLTAAVLAGTGPYANATTPPAGVGVVSSNATVTLNPQLWGNVEAAAVTGSSGTRVGTNTVPAQTKPMPAAKWPTLAAYYANLAAPLTTGLGSASDETISNALLTPANDPYGATNASGIYSVTLAAGADLTISGSRIQGTLVVLAGSKCTVTVNGPVCWQPAVPNAPILIVSGDQPVVNVTGSTSWLSEGNANLNFNPAGSPYNGVTNATASDDYPPQLQGLIYVTGNRAVMKLSNNPVTTGSVLCDGTIEVDGPAAVVQNTATYANPPVGFANGDGVAEVPGTWRWDTLP